MTPKQAFDATLARAQYLLDLRVAFANRRQRRIRSDWKASFCSLMHWPQSATIERVDSTAAIVILRDGASVTPSALSSDRLDELLRAALVLGVSALDRYVHERVTKRIVTALRVTDLCRQQEELSIPAVLALGLADDLRTAQRTGKLTRPANEVRNVIQEALYRRPFQNWRDLEYAFSLIGIRNMTGQLQSNGKLANIIPLKDQLDRIVKRRNQIVHEGDLIRHQRGGKPRPHPVDVSSVRGDLDFIKDLVTKLEGLS